MSPARRSLRDATERAYISAGYSVLDSIKPVEASYVALVVRGATRKAACQELRISEPTGQRIEAEDWWLAACKEERKNWIGGDRRTAFEPIVPEALTQLFASVRRGEEWGVKYSLDQFFGRPLQQVQSSSQVQHSVPALDSLVDVLRSAQSQLLEAQVIETDQSTSQPTESDSATKG